MAVLFHLSPLSGIVEIDCMFCYCWLCCLTSQMCCWYFFILKSMRFFGILILEFIILTCIKHCTRNK
jgi:hypothetical protein